MRELELSEPVVITKGLFKSRSGTVEAIYPPTQWSSIPTYGISLQGEAKGPTYFETDEIRRA